MAVSDFARSGVRRLVALLVIAASPIGSVAAREQLPSNRLSTQSTGVDAAAADPITDTSGASPSAAELEALQRADELTIRNAMTQLAGSPNDPVAERLPQSEFVSDDEIVSALGYPTAWKNPGRENHMDEAYRNAVAEWIRRAAWLYFDEWSCSTGGETGVAHQMVDLLPKLVTRYPERLMLRAFIQERDLLGYPRTRTCNSGDLDHQRSRYQQKLSVVLEGL